MNWSLVSHFIISRKDIISQLMRAIYQSEHIKNILTYVYCIISLLIAQPSIMRKTFNIEMKSLYITNH